MDKRRKFLKRTLAVLVGLFVLTGVAVMVLARYREGQREEIRRQEVLDTLEKIQVATPTPVPVTSTPTPVPTATPTPTPIPTRLPAFAPDDFYGTWYSADGLAAMEIYELNRTSVSFYFSQTDRRRSGMCEADLSAEVAGNAAQFSFSDTYGNEAEGNLIFDNGELYVRITTYARASDVCPDVNCIMQRERPYVEWEVTPEPVPTQGPVSAGDPGEYFFPESGSRYLSDEEISAYSAEQLELAKNEIYARRGRIFVTDWIADYFNSKSWYHGTIDPEEFDARQEEIFNDYELSNIYAISEWAEKKRSEGN